MGVTQSGCWVVEKTLILQGFLALSIWKNQRKSLVDTKLIPPLSGDRIIQKSLKARKFVFLKTNLRAFFTVILRILWNTMKRGANKNFSKIFVDTVDFYPLKFRISERTWNYLLYQDSIEKPYDCEAFDVNYNLFIDLYIYGLTSKALSLLSLSK